jgi:hypothetical protein
MSSERLCVSVDTPARYLSAYHSSFARGPLCRERESVATTFLHSRTQLPKGELPCQ